MTATATTDRRDWLIAGVLFRFHLPFLALCWLGIVAIVGLVIAGIAIFGTVRVSVLDQSGSIVRWAILGYGTHLTYRLLPTYIAHGLTRREFALQSTVFIAGSAPILAGLVTLGYYLESLLYRANGWTHGVSGDRLYDSPDQYPLVFATWTVLFGVWAMVGAFLAAVFYRDDGLGLLALPLGLGILVGAGLIIGHLGLPFLRGTLWDDAPPLGAVAVCLGAFAVAAALTWVTVRNLPLRNKAP
jgi:hypothetical protein